ncbi:MAG: DUF4476 domain-containing protein [Sphingobacteriales bacterium]|nr:MAG: DUF4476 domain-containing protein [Sphingobacteriales bacterium]
MGRTFRFIAVACSLLFLSVQVFAEKFSYVYVQGDKNIPFYVKFEGEMLPRFGKNYYIISELAPGPISIEILFQQNAYPAQKFIVQVPESSFRGFLLMQKDGTFKLYDIHRQFYLSPDNKIEDDKVDLPPVPAYANNNFTPVVPTPIAQKEPATEEVISKPAPKPLVKKPTATVSKIKVPAKPVSNIVVNNADEGPSFIGDMELKNNKTQQGGNMMPAGGNKATANNSNKLAVINSDCPSAMSNNQFDVLLKRVNSRAASEKLKVIFDKMDNCFTSNQIKILTKTLQGDDQRFTLLKKAYPRVTDQSAFEALENLLSGEDWKGYFRDMVHK